VQVGDGILDVDFDVETRSALNLKRVGVYRYAADASTSVICLAFKINGGETEVWRPGQPVPQVFFDIASNPRARVFAHNAQFERVILSRILHPRHGFPLIPIERWRCTMAMALAAALPGALENVARALDLPEQKSVEGHKLMLAMSRPKRVRGTNSAGPIWIEDAESIERLCQYCKQDVEVEHALRQRLRPLSDDEQMIWLVDQAINTRGFRADRGLAEAAAAVAKQERVVSSTKIAELTGDAITSAYQVERIKDWVRERGHQLASLQPRSIMAVLAHGPDEETRKLLELRLEGSRTSASKYHTLLGALEGDDRLRGMLRYHAGAPGRWSGQLAQPQNLKKVEIVKDFDAAIAAVQAGDLDRVRDIGDPLTVIGDLLRSTICAAPGHVLIGADFSAIESRVLAWIAGEQWKVDNYFAYDRTGDPTLEPYCVTATRILRRNTPVTPDDKPARAIGKVADLAFGFGGSVGLWRKWVPDDGRSDEEILVVVRAWRAAHPRIGTFWRGLESAAKTTIRTRRSCRFKRLGTEFVDGTLRIKLPSGRGISYPEAHIGPGKFENTTAITFKDNANGGWADVDSWYGSLTENVVQGIARDLLAAAIVRIEQAGFPVVLHCHDEIISEVPVDSADDDTARLGGRITYSGQGLERAALY
jgi:DNA polymerase